MFKEILIGLAVLVYLIGFIFFLLVSCMEGGQETSFWQMLFWPIDSIPIDGKLEQEHAFKIDSVYPTRGGQWKIRVIGYGSEGEIYGNDVKGNICAPSIWQADGSCKNEPSSDLIFE